MSEEVEVGLLRRDTENEFVLRYDGETHEIDAFTLAHSVVEIATLLQLINVDLETGNKIDIRIKALTADSFDVNVVLYESALPALLSVFTPSHLSTAKDVVQAFLNFLNIRKLLKKETPAKVEATPQNTQVINHVGDVIFNGDPRIWDMYNKPNMEKAIDQLMQTLDSDPAIKGFEVKDPSGLTQFESKREEFEEMILDAEYSVQDDTQLVVRDAYLKVVKPSYDRRYVWEFQYLPHKKRIHAHIADPTYLDLVDERKAPFSGDVLQVKLQVEETEDRVAAGRIAKSYLVLKVVKIIPKDGEQASLLPFFDLCD